MNVYFKHLLVSLLVLAFFPSNGQNTIVPFEPITILKNTDFSRSFVGYQPQTIAKQHGSVQITGSKPNFSFEYTPDSNFVGTDTLIIQIQDSEDWFRHQLMYLSYIIEVRPSTVYAYHDYFTVQLNDSAVILDITVNDSTSAGAINIAQLPLVNFGDATVIGQQIEFTPERDYTGLAYVSYVICDSLGACDNGAVTISVVDSTLSVPNDTLRAVTKEDVEFSQPLPDVVYTVSDSAEHGEVVFLAPDLFKYIPDAGYFGKDSFKLLNSTHGSHRLYRVDVLERKDNRSTLVDDVIFTAVNHPVWFDVQENDVSDNFGVKTLKHPALGTLIYVDSVDQYKYTPPQNIESIETFEYGLKGGRINEKATGTIYINDGHPEGAHTYFFETYRNEPFVVQYEIPIDEHEFKLKYPPVAGFAADIYNHDTTIVVGCDTITGSHLLVLTPAHNFYGPYTFNFEHCVEGTSICRDINITLFSNAELAPGCVCKDNCVWSGDINYDGRVNMKDLLPLAHHIGESGATRNNTTTNWEAQYADLWQQNIDGTNIDLKHADTDGDGILGENDTLAISNNYYREHGLVPELVGPSRQYAFYLEPRFDTVLAGELAVVDVVFGAVNYPIVDMEGVAYTLNFAPHVEYDSASMKVTNSATSFLTYNSPYLDMSKQPRYRQVDVGVARTNGSVSSGYGVISTLEFIVDDDLYGFRYEDGVLPLTINLRDAVGMSGSGATYSLPDAEVTLYLNVAGYELPFNADRVTVWPNPARGVVNLHLNGTEEMLSASLWTMDGRLVQTWKEIDADHQRLVMDENLSGMYILRVETTAGAVAKKLQLINR